MEAWERSDAELAAAGERAAAPELAVLEQVQRWQAAATAAEEREGQLELVRSRQERQIIELKQAQANRDAEHAATLKTALAGAGTELEARLQELKSARERDQQQQAALESRLQQLVEREQGLATQIKRYEETAAYGDTRRQDLETLLASLQRRNSELEQSTAHWSSLLEQAQASAQADAQALARLQARNDELNTERAGLLDHQMELSSRLEALVKRQASIAEELENAGADPPLATVSPPNAEPPARRRAFPSWKAPAHGPRPDCQEFSIRQWPGAARIARRLPTARRTADLVVTPPSDAADPGDDLVNRLMAYHSRGQAARRRRLVIISLGVAAAALVVVVVAFQSLNQIWSSG